MTRPALAALVALAASAAAAQPDAPSEGAASVFRYAEPGEVVMTVDLLGAVGRPGRYVLRPGVGALDLLVLAGGPAVARDVGAGALTATVRVLRRSPSGPETRRATVAALTDGTAALALADGDVVSVQTAGPGSVAVAVDVWGAVGRPGRHTVEPGATLVDVLTAAGGPAPAAEGGDVARTLLVTLARPAAGGARTVVYDGPVAALASAAAPAVEPGDLVSVRVVERRRFGFRDGLAVVSAAAGVAVLVLRIAGGSD